MAGAEGKLSSEVEPRVVTVGFLALDFKPDLLFWQPEIRQITYNLVCPFGHCVRKLIDRNLKTLWFVLPLDAQSVEEHGPSSFQA